MKKDSVIFQLEELQETIRRIYRDNLRNNRDVDIDAGSAVALMIIDSLIKEVNGCEDT